MLAENINGLLGRCDMREIIVAIITGGLALLGTVITCIATSKKQSKDIEVNQAIMKTQIEQN